MSKITVLILMIMSCYIYEMKGANAQVGGYSSLEEYGGVWGQRIGEGRMEFKMGSEQSMLKQATAWCQQFNDKVDTSEYKVVGRRDRSVYNDVACYAVHMNELAAQPRSKKISHDSKSSCDSTKILGTQLICTINGKKTYWKKVKQQLGELNIECNQVPRSGNSPKEDFMKSIPKQESRVHDKG